MQNEKWNKVLDQLKQDISENDFDMFLKPLSLISFTETELIINVKNAYIRDKIIEKYKKKIEKTIKKMYNIDIYISFKMDNVLELFNEKENNPQGIPVELKQKAGKSKNYNNLEKKFTFSNFVTGPSNELAYAAGKRICSAPGQQYNPFFYYGPTGLGKTHLLHAIGREALEINPSIKVIYVTSETFLDEYVNSLAKTTVGEFRNKYRSADFLLVDDIHFFEGKPGIQDELFNTFNLLYMAQKQMVFTSDRSIKELKGIQERLVHRFAQGLAADIKPPGYEERKAILNQKVKDGKVKIDPQVLDFIAQKVSSNVRNLEGAINKIKLIQELKDRLLTVEDAKVCLDDVLDTNKNIVTPDQILRESADYYKISLSELKGKTRRKNVAKPRQMAMYLMRELTKLSFIQVGLEFGGRDHSTVYHACQCIEKELTENLSTRNDYELLYNRLMK